MPVDDITHAYPHVEVDPDRLSGVPTIKGRRVSARAVAELAAVPGGSSTLKQEYDLTADQINDASRWWKEAQKLAAKRDRMADARLVKADGAPVPVRRPRCPLTTT